MMPLERIHWQNLVQHKLSTINYKWGTQKLTFSSAGLLICVTLARILLQIVTTGKEMPLLDIIVPDFDVVTEHLKSKRVASMNMIMSFSAETNGFNLQPQNLLHNDCQLLILSYIVGIIIRWYTYINMYNFNSRFTLCRTFVTEYSGPSSGGSGCSWLVRK